VPSYARDWNDVLRKDAYRGALHCEVSTLAYWRHIGIHGTAQGAATPAFFACGSDSCYGWAKDLVDEGHVLIKKDGRITLQDNSGEPDFTLNPEYAEDMLKNSPDHALRDMTTVVGVDFGAKLRPQLVMMPPMQSLEHGFVSVHKSLDAMADSGWFGVELADGIGKGKLSINSFPGRCQSIGCVPRAYSNVWRMIVNGSYGEHRELWTTVGVRERVFSLNSATGAGADKAIRRAEALAARVAKPTRGAISVQAISERAPYRAPARLPGSGEDGAAVLPPELKGFFYQLVVTIVKLDYVGGILGLEVILMGDDWSKYFHLFALARRQHWACQMMSLDPKAVAAGDLSDSVDAMLASMSKAELALISEYCMSMGTTPSSSVAQRYSNELMLKFMRRFHEEHLEVYAEWERTVPAFADYLAECRALSLETGYDETYLMVALCYTDDPTAATVGPVLACDMTETFDEECTAAGLIRGDASKRSFGVHLKWVGAYAFSTGLLSYMPKPKMMSADARLTEMSEGRLTVRQVMELGGLLHHVVFTLALPLHVMYNFYDGVDALRRSGRIAASVRRTLRALFICGGPPDDSPDGLLAIGRRHGFEVDNIDILVGGQILKPRTQQYVLTGLESRRWYYVHGANPCRTYSILHTPVLRTPRWPRGIVPMPRTWARLIAKDTAIMLFTAEVYGLADDLDLAWSGEHPSPRSDTSSIAHWPEYEHVGTQWHDKAFRDLAKRPTVDFFDMAQCYQGSDFQKYTRFIGSKRYLKHLRPRLKAGVMCSHKKHAKTAFGKDDGGHNVSESSAHYPPMMKDNMFAAAREAADEAGVNPVGGGDLDDARLVPTTKRSLGAIHAWQKGIKSRSGSSMLGSIFHGSVPQNVMRHRLHADAAKRGTNFPGISGNLYGDYYVVDLTGTRHLKLPIIALEFAGEGPLNLSTFEERIGGDGVVVLPCDSLIAPLIMASSARRSKLMVYLHELFMAMPVVLRLWSRLVVSHEFGVGNPICDRGSRGNKGEMLEIMAQLRLKPNEHKAHPDGVEFLDKASDFLESLSAEDRAMEMEVLAAMAQERDAARRLREQKASVALSRRSPRVGKAGVLVAAAALTQTTSALGAEVAERMSHQVGSAFSSCSLGDGAPPFRPARRLTELVSVVEAVSTLPAPLVAPPTARGGTVLAAHPPQVPRRLVASSPPLTSSLISTLRARPRGSAIAPVRLAAAPLDTIDEPDRLDRFTGWEAALLQDTSPFAILPNDPELLAGYLDMMRDSLENAYAESTNNTDKYHLRAWQHVCRKLGTPMWRTDVAANSGLDPVGHRRELVLSAIAGLLMYADMSPRSNKDPLANPRSMLQKLYGVSREHKKRGYIMARFTMATQVMVGLLHKYVRDHGIGGLAPSRKNPLTNEIIAAMLALPSGTVNKNGKLIIVWGQYMWIALRATFEVLAETGMRKGDVSKAYKSTAFRKGRITFAKIRWLINGTRVAAPTIAQLMSMTSGGVWIIFGALKNDPFGEFFGSKPAFLPFDAGATRNACRALRDLEIAAANAGLDVSKRDVTPLFGPALGVEWHHSLIEDIFMFMLLATGLVTKEEALGFSMHSWRIYLACALYSAGCPKERIMAILRWKSEEALLIYARLDDDERADWVSKGMSRIINSTTAEHLPRLDADEWVHRLQQSAADGSLGKAAAAADASDARDLDEMEDG